MEDLIEIFEDYEKSVLGILINAAFSKDEVSRILEESQFVNYEYTGSGYFLSVSHEILPKERIVLDNPIVIGKSQDCTCGFVVFIEDHILTLECHSWSEKEVSPDFRSQVVQIMPVTIESGEFIPIKQSEN